MKVWFLRVLLAVGAFSLGACVGPGDIANSLTRSMNGQADMEIARLGVPAYIVMADAMIEADPDDAAMLLAGSRLYGAYVSAFVDDPERSKVLTGRAWQYAKRAFCVEASAKMCAAVDKPLAEFQANLDSFDMKESAAYLYGLAAAWAGWIQTHTADWTAIADLPKVELCMRRIVAMNDRYDNGNVQLYLGVLNTQLPASLGGKPEVGKVFFEKALEISGGRNLMAKVLYAKYYARLVFDKELHDRLLQEVLRATEDDPSLRLVNVIAKRQAKELLATTDDYF